MFIFKGNGKYLNLRKDLINVKDVFLNQLKDILSN